MPKEKQIFVKSNLLSNYTKQIRRLSIRSHYPLFYAHFCCLPNISLPLVGGTVTYLAKIPCDPSGISWYNSGNYFYSLNGNTYTLRACIENSNDTDQNVVAIALGCSSTKVMSSQIHDYRKLRVENVTANAGSR